MNPHSIDIGIVPIVSEMMNNGIRIDVPYFRGLSKTYQERMENVQETLDMMFGHHINCNSSDQIVRSLKELNIRVESADHDTIEPLALKHPVVRLIQDYKMLSKLKGTYIDKFPKLLDKNGRLHTRFGITKTETGRLDSSDPNLMNIPSRTPEGQAIRKGFVAEDGYVLLRADYSQIEMRLLACVSDDSVMLKLYAEGVDLHTYLASKIFKCKMEEVSKTQRKFAKNTNFMVGYGVTAQGLFNRLTSEGIATSIPQCERFINSWFAEFKQAGEYFKSVHEFARTHGYVENWAGRRRWVPEVYSSIDRISSAGIRQAGNFPIQSGAQEIIKIAMHKLYNEKAVYGDMWRALLQIHDELITEVREELVDDAKHILVNCMESSAAFKLPFTVEPKKGINWLEMEVMK
jgi:DNA polymerase-1